MEGRKRRNRIGGRRESSEEEGEEKGMEIYRLHSCVFVYE